MPNLRSIGKCMARECPYRGELEKMEFVVPGHEEVFVTWLCPYHADQGGVLESKDLEAVLRQIRNGEENP